MVMLRLVFSAAILLLIARPTLRGHSRHAWTGVIWFGVVLATMNALFYLALERLPLGVTVTIEVLGAAAELPGTEEAARSNWALPMGTDLTEEQLRQVVECVVDAR